MALGLRPGVSFCEASGHLVFLDLDADRYFGLADVAEAAFRHLLQRETHVVAGQDVGMFLDSQLLVHGPDALPLRPCSPPATTSESLLDRRLPAASVLPIVRALISMASARSALHLAGLSAALRTLATRKTRMPARPSDPAKMECEAAAFHRCAVLVRSHDQCLVRSLALVHRLADRGERADLVIGVRVRPFSAHAWVQKGHLLLNESCDAVRGFTPILVL